MPPDAEHQTPQQLWDEIHGRRDPERVGRPHAEHLDLLAGIPPGRALELGSGDGADAIWLARHGWGVTPVDVSPVVQALAADQARAADVGERVTWVAADLAGWSAEEDVDLVCSFFLHTTRAFDRTGVLRRASERVRPGGTLLVVGHLTLPPWAWDPDDTGGLPTARALADDLGLENWERVVVEDRPRDVEHPDGRRARITDAVLCARRLSR